MDVYNFTKSNRLQMATKCVGTYVTVCTYYYVTVAKQYTQTHLLAALISRIGIHGHFMTCTIGWIWL